MTRSILAIIVPVLCWGLLWVGGNAVVSSILPQKFAEGIPQTTAVLVFFICYSSALSIGAGALCTKIAARLKMRHVVILAIVQLAIGILVQASVWTQMPLWYHLMFLALVIPAHLCGGALATGGRKADVAVT